MNRIAIDSSIPYTKGLIDDLAVVKYIDHGNFIYDNVKDANAFIVRSTIKCDKALMSSSNLKFVSTATAGFDHIDTKYCEDNGIEWSNSPGCNRESVAEYVISALARVLLKKGKTFRDINCLGIVGVGYTGSSLDSICKSIGIKTMLCDPIRAEKEGPDGFFSLDELAKKCDVFSFHVPLNRDEKYPTYHLIDEDFLSKTSDDIILINACRGAVADTTALKYYYKKNKFNSLIIDCWEGEPNIDTELLSMVDIATTHIAGFSADSKAKSTIMSINNVLRFFDLPTLSLDCIHLDLPDNQIIDLSGIDESIQVETAIIASNKLEDMDNNFRRNPDKFEHLRESYIRPREFSAYKVKLANENNKKILSNLGFFII